MRSVQDRKKKPVRQERKVSRAIKALIAGLFAFALGLFLSAYPFSRFRDFPEVGDGMIRAALASDVAHKDEAAIVAELFTSQSCSSCPAAEALFRDLSQRKDVATFEFHVDYWDSLVYGAQGRWKDVFSKPEWTQRQARYNESLSGSDRVYTPQAVIDGRWETVGSKGPAIEALIAKAKNQRRDSVRISLAIQNGAYHLQVAPLREAAQVLLVVFKERAVTRVLHGENHGKTLASYNVVTGLWDLGPVGADGFDSPLDVSLTQDEGCAVLLQNAKTLAIQGVRFCPAGTL